MVLLGAGVTYPLDFGQTSKCALHLVDFCLSIDSIGTSANGSLQWGHVIETYSRVVLSPLLCFAIVSNGTDTSKSTYLKGGILPALQCLPGQL